ncbi:hypothetical protein [Bacteriovorax sp. Seq25_V]|uniref:hypothetical protein n=1 Tax=Bacteriovorax sp. Seq25_V TaxID=1201288 RepID=UPI00038A3B6A|nr:hypothetical protein [Bacteriovorax sp. Seq25_V]EQC43789.1 hypothetical protein M900_1213 [Bacteriovorax sp. Seq25_V]
MKLFGSILLFLTILISSCSAPKSSTNAKFGLSFLNSDYDTGGLMVFGKNNRTNEYVGKNLTAGVNEFELTNGTWDFIAIAWGSASNIMEGTSKCGRVEGVNLSGEDTSVNFILTQDQCEKNDVFGKRVTFESNFQIAPITILNCTNINAGDDPDINDIAKKCFMGGAKSMKLKIPEFDENGSVSTANALSSRCFDFSSTPQLATTIKVPIFNDQASPLQVIYEAYTGSGCTGNVIALNSKQHNKTRLKYQPANQINYVFAQVDYCQAERNTQSVLLNSVGGSYYMICSKAQFIEAFSASNDTNMYVLAKNIDFEGEEMSQHLLNIGSGGELVGQGFTLSNFTLTSTGPVENQALFKTVAGTIRELNITDVTADYDFTVVTTQGAGILIGQSTAAAQFEKISMARVTLDVTIDTNMDGFGIFCGICQNHTGLSDIKIDASQILLSGNSTPTLTGVGFIAGQFAGNLSTSSVTNSSILANDSFTLVSKVGGVLGFNSASSFVSDINVETVSIKIQSPSQSIGGFVGFASELNNFMRTYINASIEVPAGATQPDIGGAIGKLTSAGAPIITSINTKISITGGAKPAGGIVGTDLGTGTVYTFVNADTNLSGEGTCGGIVGNGSGASYIKYARTRGVINCPTASIGGIAGTTGATLVSVHSKSDLTNTSSAGSGGLVGNATSGSISDSMFTGSISFANNVNNGLFVGTTTGISISNIVSTADNLAGGYDVAGSASTGNTTVSANCYFMNQASIASGTSCQGYGTTLALVSDFNTGSPDPTYWKTASGVIPQLHSDLLQELFPNSAGAIIKPYSITGVDRWNAIANVMNIDVNSHLPYSSFLLTGTIDFANDSSLFHQWPVLRGRFNGNNQIIRNISYDSGSYGSGLFGTIYEGSIVNGDNIKGKLILENINFQSSSTSSPMGILASQVSLTAGESLIANIILKNSSVSSNTAINGTGLIGAISADPSSNIYISDIKIINSTFTSSASDNLGAITGNFNAGTTPSAPNLQNIFIDSSSLIDGSGQNYVGGIIGTGTGLIGFGLISEAEVRGAEYVGGAFGYLSNTSVIQTSIISAIITSAGTNVSGIVGGCATSSVMNSYTTSTLNGGATHVVGTGCTASSSFSTSSGRVHNTSSSVSAETVSQIQSDYSLFISNLNDSTFAFYYDFGNIPRLRLEEHLRSL